MTISFEDAKRLEAAGFLEYEIAAFALAIDGEGKPQPPVILDSPVWLRVLASRREWVDDKIERGWTDEQITETLMDYYRRKEERTPWDFLKAEYRPPMKVDYTAAIRRRAQMEVAELMRR